MNIILLTFITNLPALASIIIGGYLAYHDVSYWGWFLVIALLVVHSPSTIKKETKNER